MKQVVLIRREQSSILPIVKWPKLLNYLFLYHVAILLDANEQIALKSLAVTLPQSLLTTNTEYSKFGVHFESLNIDSAHKWWWLLSIVCFHVIIWIPKSDIITVLSLTCNEWSKISCKRYFCLWVRLVKRVLINIKVMQGVHVRIWESLTVAASVWTFTRIFRPVARNLVFQVHKMVSWWNDNSFYHAKKGNETV